VSSSSRLTSVRVTAAVLARLIGSLQLTPEQEQRILTVVDAGAFSSTEEALDATVAAVEVAAAPGFEGTQEDLEKLLLDGLNSGE
jgi:hypothetical protein